MNASHRRRVRAIGGPTDLAAALDAISPPRDLPVSSSFKCQQGSQQGNGRHRPGRGRLFEISQILEFSSGGAAISLWTSPENSSPGILQCSENLRLVKCECRPYISGSSSCAWVSQIELISNISLCKTLTVAALLEVISETPLILRLKPVQLQPEHKTLRI